MRNWISVALLLAVIACVGEATAGDTVKRAREVVARENTRLAEAVKRTRHSLAVRRMTGPRVDMLNHMIAKMEATIALHKLALLEKNETLVVAAAIAIVRADLQRHHVEQRKALEQMPEGETKRKEYLTAAGSRERMLCGELRSLKEWHDAQDKAKAVAFLKNRNKNPALRIIVVRALSTTRSGEAKDLGTDFLRALRGLSHRVRVGNDRQAQKELDGMGMSSLVSEQVQLAVCYNTERTNYFMGEPIVVECQTINIGRYPVIIETGGDTRMASRPQRLLFRAVSDAGIRAIDPAPQWGNMGGPAPLPPVILPGESYSKRVNLLDYVLFPKAGKYTVTGYLDIGVDGIGPVLEESHGRFRHCRVGELTVTMTDPTPEDAEALVSNLIKSGHKRAFLRLRHSSYLEPLQRRLSSDKKNVGLLIHAIGTIPAREAVSLLLRVAQKGARNEQDAAFAVLNGKIPFKQPWWDRNQMFREHFAFKEDQFRRYWPSEHREKLVAIALNRLSLTDDLHRVAGAGTCLANLGKKDHLPVLRQAFDRVDKEAPESREKTSVLESLNTCAQLLAKREGVPHRTLWKFPQEPEPDTKSIDTLLDDSQPK